MLNIQLKEAARTFILVLAEPDCWQSNYFRHYKLKQEELKKAFKEARSSLSSSPLIPKTSLASEGHAPRTKAKVLQSRVF